MAEGLNDEATLVQQAANGDQQAFASLYERYFDGVYDFLTRLVRDREAAADLTQDTFIRAMNNLAGLQKGGSFKSWLFTIAHNAGLNHLKRAARTQPLVMDETDEPAFDVVDTDRFASPHEALAASQLAALVWEAAAGLDARQYAVLDLTLRQGLESAELADVLGVSKNNAYVMVNRMKQTLEESVAALMLFRDRRHCGDLAALLTSHEALGMSPDTRRLIDRHAGRCEVCKQKRATMVSPSAIFGGLAFVPAPAGLKLSIGQFLQQNAAAGAANGADQMPGDSPGSNGPPRDSQPRQSPEVEARYQQSDAAAAATDSKLKRVAAVIAALALLIFGASLVLGSASSDDTTKSSLGLKEPDGTKTIAAITGVETTTTQIAGATPSAVRPEPGATEAGAPEVAPTAVAQQPGAIPPVSAVLQPPDGQTTPAPVMPGFDPPVAPGGNGPAATPQPGVFLPVATPTPGSGPSVALPTATAQAGALVITPVPPARTPTPVCVPTAVVAATTLDFGASQAPQMVVLKSDGCSAATTFTVTPASSWIGATPGNGSIALGGTQAISIRPIAAGMAAGQNTGRVRITTSQGSVDITVRATGSSLPPTRTPTPCAAPCLKAP